MYGKYIRAGYDGARTVSTKKKITAKLNFRVFRQMEVK